MEAVWPHSNECKGFIYLSLQLRLALMMILTIHFFVLLRSTNPYLQMLMDNSKAQAEPMLMWHGAEYVFFASHFYHQGTITSHHSFLAHDSIQSIHIRETSNEIIAVIDGHRKDAWHLLALGIKEVRSESGMEDGGRGTERLEEEEEKGGEKRCVLSLPYSP